jgi:hypothetical protein
MMTLPRTAAEVLSEHVGLEIRSVDRMLLLLRQPRLQYGQGIHGFFCHHRGWRFVSSELMRQMTESFTAELHYYIESRDLVHFKKDQRKFCGYFPFTAQIYLNGHEYAKQQCRRAGIGFTAADNSFAAVDDPDAVQQICDGMTPEKISRFVGKWLARLPHPFTIADDEADYHWELTVQQVELATTQVLDTAAAGRIFFDQLIRDNLDIGRPDKVRIVFDRLIYRRGAHRTPGSFRTQVITSGVDPYLYLYYKKTQVKQYLIISSRSFRVAVLQGVWHRRHVLDASWSGDAGDHSGWLTRRSRRSPSSRATCSCSRAFSVRSQVRLHRLHRQQVLAQHRAGHFTA